MTDYIKQISSLENLMLAWRKLERAFSYGDVWFDGLIIAAFKLNLVENLKKISQELKEGTYKMKPIQPIPFPKGGKDCDGNFKVRQSFFVDFRDQLVWVAVCNVIGRTFDVMMPAWSYGNRQYVSMWKECDDNGQHWVIGNHRNTTRQIYRKWTQSWPLMRKRITASLKKMAKLKSDDLDDVDAEVYNDEKCLNGNQKFFRLQYLEDGYFPESKEEKTIDELYWVGIDLTQFYQKVKLDKVRAKIESVLKSKSEIDDAFIKLLNTITHFEIDYSDYQYEGADDDLKTMQLVKNGRFDGLPTGLIVAGMLANIFMLDIDEQVSTRLKEERDIIHFRYVDDHVIISTSKEKLFEWLAWYQQLLSENGLVLNVAKLTPEGLLKDLDENGDKDTLENLRLKDKRDVLLGNIGKYACIDPKYPTPLMTQTLQKISMLQGLNLNMLSTREFEMVFRELQSLLVADFSEQEIKEGTRISFACTMLTRLIVDGDVDYEKIYYFRRQWLKQVDKIKENLFKQLSDKTAHEEYDTKEKIDKVIAACNNIIFNDIQPIDIHSLKSSYPKIDFDGNYLKKINEALERGQSVTKRKERQVFNMLMYALDKVPDKVRIWVRAFHYCICHEPAQIEKLYKKLDDCKDSKLHRLSVDFLTALLNTLSAENIIKATSRLVFNDYKIPFDVNKDKEFLRHIRNVKTNNSEHFFVRDSNYLLSKAFAFFDLYAKKIKMKAYDNEESFFSPYPKYHDYNLDSTFWLLWAADLLKMKSPKDKPIFSQLLNDSLGEAKVESEYFRAFFFEYLREVSISSGKEMKMPSNWDSKAEWLNQSAKYTITHLSGISGIEKLLADEERKKNQSVSIKNAMNLTQWIEYLNDIEKTNSRYELMHSELISVLLMLSVIKAIEQEGENKDLVKLHPENFYLDKSEFEKNWSDYISMIDNEKLFNVVYLSNSNIDNSPYDYPKILNPELPQNTSMSYGLGIIFLQLLSKKKILPWALNSEQVGFEWQYILHELQGQGKLSSLNYRIASACLSPRQRENLLLSQILGDEGGYIQDFRDKPEIQNWEQLRDELKKSLRHLRNNLISVADEEHRQLTVIDLD